MKLYDANGQQLPKRGAGFVPLPRPIIPISKEELVADAIGFLLPWTPEDE